MTLNVAPPGMIPDTCASREVVVRRLLGEPGVTRPIPPATNRDGIKPGQVVGSGVGKLCCCGGTGGCSPPTCAFSGSATSWNGTLTVAPIGGESAARTGDVNCSNGMRVHVPLLYW